MNLNRINWHHWDIQIKECKRTENPFGISKKKKKKWNLWEKFPIRSTRNYYLLRRKYLIDRLKQHTGQVSSSWRLMWIMWGPSKRKATVLPLLTAAASPKTLQRRHKWNKNEKENLRWFNYIALRSNRLKRSQPKKKKKHAHVNANKKPIEFNLLASQLATHTFARTH